MSDFQNFSGHSQLINECDDATTHVYIDHSIRKEPRGPNSKVRWNFNSWRKCTKNSKQYISPLENISWEFSKWVHSGNLSDTRLKIAWGNIFLLVYSSVPHNENFGMASDFLPMVCLQHVGDLSATCRRLVRNMSATCPHHVCDLSATCLQHDCDFYAICLQHCNFYATWRWLVCNISATCLQLACNKHACDLSATCLQHVCNVSFILNEYR